MCFYLDNFTIFVKNYLDNMIKDIFLLQNPWRENRNYTFGLKQRDILPTLVDNMENELIIGLIRSRQVGKSSLMEMLIEDMLLFSALQHPLFKNRELVYVSH